MTASYVPRVYHQKLTKKRGHSDISSSSSPFTVKRYHRSMHLRRTSHDASLECKKKAMLRHGRRVCRVCTPEVVTATNVSAPTEKRNRSQRMQRYVRRHLPNSLYICMYGTITRASTSFSKGNKDRRAVLLSLSV